MLCSAFTAVKSPDCAQGVIDDVRVSNLINRIGNFTSRVGNFINRVGNFINRFVVKDLASSWPLNGDAED